MVTSKPPKPKKRKMPGPLRVGIALMILGAILVGFGSFSGRESVSIYGFVMVVSGFFLYFVSYYYLDRLQKQKNSNPR